MTATARDARRLDDFDFPARVQHVHLDVADAQSCAAAFREAADGEHGRVEVAYFLVHSIGEGDYAEQDLTGARRFADAAADAGVGRLVYLGGFVPGGEALSAHLASRAAVGEALKDSGADLVWLRAAVVLGAGSTSFEVIRHLCDRARVVPLPPWMNQPMSPIAVNDALHYLRAAADRDMMPAGSYDISNGEQPTYADLIKAYARSRNFVRLWLPVPAVPSRIVATMASWLTPLPHELTADLVSSVPNNMRSDDQHIRDLVPEPEGGLTTTAEAMRRTVQRNAFCGVYATEDPLQLTTTDPSWAGRQ